MDDQANRPHRKTKEKKKHIDGEHWLRLVQKSH